MRFRILLDILFRNSWMRSGFGVGNVMFLGLFGKIMISITSTALDLLALFFMYMNLFVSVHGWILIHVNVFRGGILLCMDGRMRVWYGVAMGNLSNHRNSNCLRPILSCNRLGQFTYYLGGRMPVHLNSRIVVNKTPRKRASRVIQDVWRKIWAKKNKATNLLVVVISYTSIYLLVIFVQVTNYSISVHKLESCSSAETKATPSLTYDTISQPDIDALTSQDPEPFNIQKPRFTSKYSWIARNKAIVYRRVQSYEIGWS